MSHRGTLKKTNERPPPPIKWIHPEEEQPSAKTGTPIWPSWLGVLLPELSRPVFKLASRLAENRMNKRDHQTNSRHVINENNLRI